MRITQTYSGSTSHQKHWNNGANYKDYPIDDGGKDGGREAIYCPCDEMVVTAIKGVGNSATNTVWLVSTSFVYTPTFYDIAFMTLTHANDSDFENMTVGKKFHRGDILCYEGTDGASSNHIHITCGRGNSDTWIQNSNGSWVILGDTKKPEEVFYLDSSFTNVLNEGGISWKRLPKETVGTPVSRDGSKNQIEIQVSNLNARKNPSLGGEILGYVEPGIYDYLGVTEQEGYSWYQIEDFYIAYQEGWGKLYPKEVLPSTPRLVYTCTETGKYIIQLKKGEQLYLL